MVLCSAAIQNVWNSIGNTRSASKYSMIPIDVQIEHWFFIQRKLAGWLSSYVVLTRYACRCRL